MKKKAAFYFMVAVLLVPVLVISMIGMKPKPSLAQQPKSFSSYQELESYIKKNIEIARQFGSSLGYGVDRGRNLMVGMEAAAGAAPQMNKMKQAEVASDERDFSKTNIQVEGVDEADVVKSDGQFLYVISGKQVFIVDAYPAKEARVLSKIELEGSLQELFINKDQMAVFSYKGDKGVVCTSLYDVVDRKKPELKRTVEIKGSYINSRMIGDYIYIITSTPTGNPEEKIVRPKISINGQERIIPPGQIYYFEGPDFAYCYTQVTAINLLNEKEQITNRTFLTGVSQNVFASENNIYLTNTKTPDFVLYTGKLLEAMAGLVPKAEAAQIIKIKNSGQSIEQKLQQVEEVLTDYINQLDYEKGLQLEEKIREYQEKWRRDMERERNKTTIHKLAITNNRLNYSCSGEVSGQILNQFSMDEFKGYFRIATTSENWLFTGRSGTLNNMYVLDQNLKIAGRLQGLAPGERIYSARFMGNRAYLVTFRQVDPLFVIDLSKPQAPRVLGQLKIPGYSDYLHPYDENHLIGIGKEVTTEPMPLLERSTSVSPSIFPPPISRVQGLKIALFDVQNPEKPKELSKYVVEGYSDSIALHDHKAFLFSKAKNLLVLPVSVNQPAWIMEKSSAAQYQGPWQGAYVFDISPASGIKLKGKIEHQAKVQRETRTPVKRSLYIEEVLYTVSEQLVKMNELKDLREINQVKLQ